LRTGRPKEIIPPLPAAASRSDRRQPFSSRLSRDSEMLQSGRFRIFETDESGQKDISGQHVEQIVANIAELDKIIAKCEAKDV
jgi:hypothetical protein